MAGTQSNPLKLPDTHGWDREAVMALLLSRLGSQSLVSALEAGFSTPDGRKHGLPGVSTVYEWLADRPDWAAEVARARKQWAEHLVTEAQAIVDAPPERGPTGLIDPGSVRHAELRAKQRQWMASKLDRATYGEQVQVDMQVHGTIDLAGVLAEARGRVIQGTAERVEPTESSTPDWLG